MKTFKTILSFLIVALLISGLYAFFTSLNTFNSIIKESVRSLEEANKNDLPITRTLSNEDASMFTKEILAKVKIKEVHRTKHRMPMVFGTFDNKYNFIFHRIKIDSFHNSPNLTWKIEKAKLTEFVSYNSTNMGEIEFDWARKQIDSLSELNLTLWGDSIVNVTKGDSSSRISLYCHNLSVRFNQSNEVDIFLKSMPSLIYGTKPAFLEVYFQRKGSFVNLYFLIAIEEKGNFKFGQMDHFLL